MANVILPADLPTNWTGGQIVAPNGADAGLPDQYGYNYLMEQVNAAQQACNDLANSGLRASAYQIFYNSIGGGN